MIQQENNYEQDVLLSVPEKQKVLSQLERYRQALLRGNKLRQNHRHTTVSLKDLRKDPINASEYFRLKEQINDNVQVFMELDKPVKIAINFMAQSDILIAPSISMYKHVLVKMLEQRTSQNRQTFLEAGSSGVLPLLPEMDSRETEQDIDDSFEAENHTTNMNEVTQSSNIADGVHQHLNILGSTDNIEDLEEIYRKSQADEKTRQEQLETLTGVHLSKRLNDLSYNSVINKCNQVDEENQNFFDSIAKNDIEGVKRALFVNPLLAYDVNERIETALHIAVKLGHYQMVDYLLDQDFGSKLAEARDLRRLRPVDIAK